MSVEKFEFTKCDVALVVPPFAGVYQANLACHLLQALGRREGFSVGVVYGNLLFASMIGHENYNELVDEGLVLEAIFQRQAFGQDAPSVQALFEDEPEARAVEQQTGDWLARMTEILSRMKPRIIGSTCSFEQITSGIALLERCIDAFPGVTTIIGGANCEADMAEGLLSTGTRIHHVASGESEQTFVRFLTDVLRDGKTPERILKGQPCANMDALPLPEYDEFFAQHEFFLGKDTPGVANPALPHESSRGCWWGEKHHCTFCGLNGGGMAFREKSPDRIVREITTLFERYGIRRLNMTDNIMPHRYFQSVLPRLSQNLPEGVKIFYEQKANISLDKAIALKNSRITDIQPGIESLNTDILTRMNKGTTGALNLKLLRYARSLGIEVSWNLLGFFPGDKPESYREMAELLKLIPHLQPPSGFSPLKIDRFSPYFDYPERYGIKSIEPMEIYSAIFPKRTAFEKLAYFFSAEYPTGAKECPQTLTDIAETTDGWKERWDTRARPILSFVHLTGDSYVLIDTRASDDAKVIEFVSHEKLKAALAPTEDMSREVRNWLDSRRLVFEMDGGLQPLAVAPVEILRSVASSSPETQGNTQGEPVAVA